MAQGIEQYFEGKPTINRVYTKGGWVTRHSYRADQIKGNLLIDFGGKRLKIGRI